MAEALFDPYWAFWREDFKRKWIAVEAQFDVYWAANFGAVDVPALIRRHPGRFPSLHVKDGPLVQEEPHVAVGAGKMDIPPLIAAAEGDVLEWNIVELDHCGTDMMQAVRDSYAYLVGEGLAKGNK
jgi:sugar phosphate isomerase/epimerase